MYKVIWLTGKSGAGKTTLAKLLQLVWTPCVCLDGDEMRDSISLGAGFSRDDRDSHNLRVARLARVLSRQMNVVVSVISPVAKTRQTIDMNYPMITFVYLKRTLADKEGHFYEEPIDYPTVHQDRLSITDSLKKLKQIIGLESGDGPQSTYHI